MLFRRLFKDINRLRMVKDPRYRVTQFDQPISYGVMLKHVLLKRMERLYYRHCGGRQLARMGQAAANRGTLASLQGGGSIVVFLHQPFVHFILPILCANGIHISTLPRQPSFTKLAARLSKIWPGHYRRIPYRPVISIKKLMERLKADDCVVLAADGRIGQHYLTAKFGNGFIETPRGIYDLSRITGAPIVPVLLRLRPFPSFIGFDLRVGVPCAIKRSPEEELDKIERMFSWFFGHLSEQPYMWTRIANIRYALALPPRATS